MIRETIERIESMLKDHESINDEKKTELLDLIYTLKSEVGELSKTHDEQAKSVVGFAEQTAREATRTKKDAVLFKLSLDGLGKSVREFEASHPKLVGAVDSICEALANAGI